jgi:signal transduction histidine kinase
MIGTSRREGALHPETGARPTKESVWHALDRRTSLRLKLIVPVIAVTMLGVGLFGYFLVERTFNDADQANINKANATAHAAGAYDKVSRTADELDAHLANLVADDPDIIGIWVLSLSEPGDPAFASTRTTDIGRSGLITQEQLSRLRASGTVSDNETVNGRAVLVTVELVPPFNDAVVVMTNLQDESSAVLFTVSWTVAVGLGVCALEVGLLMTLLEYGLLRRVRRLHRAITAFGRGARRDRLREGAAPASRDILFNLAREVDLKLTELDHRERAGGVVTELGMLALAGAEPAALTARALQLTREAADLERCLLVDQAGPAVISSSDRAPERMPGPDLPVWLTALARSAARARKPVLAGKAGRDSHYWDGLAPRGAAAAFVPMPGMAVGTGVMVGLAHAGAEVSGGTVSLMEGVATALSESLERREASRARQESADKSKALATVSHEMRTPLNAMLGFSELLLSGSAGPLNEKQQAYLRQVDHASQHLLELVNDYLDMTRAEAGSLPLQIEAIAVGPEVSHVLELMSQTARAKQVSLHATVEDGAVVRADRLKLRQVLVNLTTNAISSTPARGHVRVEAAGGSNGVRISVIDTGAGVPEDLQHLVFVEFADLHPGERFEGGGLGLALSKRFVDAMGGFIRFTSAEGAGSIFDVWLPGENSPHMTDAAAAAGVS